MKLKVGVAKLSLLLLVYAIVVSLVACGSDLESIEPTIIAPSSSISPEVTSMPQSTRIQLTTPSLVQPTTQPTVDMSTINIDLKQEIFFDWGAEQGGMVSDIPFCVDKLFTAYHISDEDRVKFTIDNVIPPQLRDRDIQPFFLRDELDLCIYGLSDSEVLTVTLYTPERQVYASRQLEVSDYYYLSVGDITIVPFSFKWPSGFPAGQWQMTIESTSTRFEELNDLANFSISGGFNGCYESDQAVLISGKGYKSNITRLLGIYIRDGSADSGEYIGALRYTLVYSRFIQINEQGAFETSIPISSFPEERFCLVVPIEEAPEYGGHEGFFTVPGVECYDICRFERDLYLAEPRLEGRDVAAIQKRLRDLGYVEVGPIDGVFGPKTESAVLLFQRANQLAENVVADERTRQVLLSDSAHPRPFERDLYLTDPWMSGNDVAAVQQRLTDLGYTEVGAVDGLFGPKTKSALLLFKEANRLTEDGVVDQQVWQLLFSENAVAKR